MTYAESNGFSVVKWRELLNSEPRLTYSILIILANSRFHCPFAQQDQYLQRDEKGTPTDKRLKTLHLSFAMHVSQYKKMEALDTLAKIEERCYSLLNP